MKIKDQVFGNKCEHCRVRKYPKWHYAVCLLLIAMSLVIMYSFMVAPNTFLGKAELMRTEVNDELHRLGMDIVAQADTDDGRVREVNRWVFFNIDYDAALNNQSLLKGDQSVMATLERGKGVCRHMVRLALSILRSIGIDRCTPSTELHIEDDVIDGHEWFECNMGNYTLECDPTNSAVCKVA